MLWINIISTVVTALATIVLACITYCYVRETKKIRETSQNMLRLSNAPEVQVSLLSDSYIMGVYTLDLCIQNIGTGFAYDMKFAGSFTSFHPQFSNETLGEYALIKNGISHLGPGKRYQIPLLWVYTKDDLCKQAPLIGELTYQDLANQSHCKTFHLEFEKSAGYTQIGDPSLENIAVSLKFIQRDLSDIRKKYAPDSDKHSQ